MATHEKLVDTVYAATYQPELWPQAMALLTELTHSKSAALFVHEKQLGQENAFFAHGVPKPVVMLYRKLGRHIDPAFKRMRDAPVGVAQSIADLSVSTKGSAYETLLLRPAGVHAVLGVCLLNSEQVHAGLGIHRSREQGSFDKAACSLVEAVAPRFARAVTIYREFAKVNARTLALHAGLERLSVGTILFDHFARPVYANPRARYLFENHPATRFEDVPIVNDKTMAHRLQNAILEAIEGDSDEMTLGLFHRDRASPLILQIVSLAEDGAALVPAGLARCAVYVSDPDLSPPISPEALQQLYGLSRTESQLAVGLANGHSLNEIAEMHHVQRSTVKTQLASVFQKMGVSRQADLVRIVLTMPMTCRR